MPLCEKIVFSRHFIEDRSGPRHIPLELVRSVFRGGYTEYKQPDGTYRVFHSARGRTLIVVVRVLAGRRCLIVTAFWGDAQN